MSLTVGQARWIVVGLLLVLGALPASALAQSGIAGKVTDETGGVLPGTLVEARSPALIEQVRTAVADGEGVFQITNLRPGTYEVRFVLAGFSTLVRTGIQLAADFTATLNVQLGVGGVEELITVSGQAPIVDVQSTTRRDVVSRDLIDALPSARNFQSVMQSLPAVDSQNAKFDVGGSNALQQGSGAAYGGNTSDFVLTVDNMTVSTPIGAGDRVGLYINDGGFEENVYTVNAGSAEQQAPGIKVNLIPKQGGNTFSGQFLGMFANEDMQSENITTELTQAGLGGVAGLYKTYDVNASLGGPILQDRLWFFTSYRYWTYNDYFLNLFNEDGSRFHDTNTSRAFPVRLTAQVTPRNKVTVAFEKTGKERKYSGVSAVTPPESATWQALRQHWYGQAKWTSSISSRMLAEAGISVTRHDLPFYPQPEIAVTKDFPYGDISRRDLITGVRSGSTTRNILIKWWNYFAQTSLSYVTGSHSIKVGMQQRWGASQSIAKAFNGDMEQRYRNGVPDSVGTFSAPTDTRAEITADFGLYVQDTWKLDRLTLNPGVRYDYFDGKVPQQTSVAGRWTPSRSFDEVPFPGWSNGTFRFGAAYDLSGDGKTAIKGSVGLYVEQAALAPIEALNPLGSALGGGTDTRTWADLNGNDIAEENELGPSTNLNLGLAAAQEPNPDLGRPKQMLYNLSVEHELLPGLGLSVSYNRRGFHDLTWVDNLANTHADWTMVTTPDPRGSGLLPIYILDANLVGRTDGLEMNSTDNTRTYNGFDVNLNARFDNGATLVGGTSTGRVTAVSCQVDNPNGLRFCDDGELSIPFLTTFKAYGTYPLPFGIELSAVFQSQPGNEKVINYSVGRSIVPQLTTASQTVRLNEPGSEYYERVNMLDFSISTRMTVGDITIRPKFELFNAFNANYILSEITTFGSALGRPTSILNGRLIRLNAVLDF